MKRWYLHFHVQCRSFFQKNKTGLSFGSTRWYFRMGWFRKILCVPVHPPISITSWMTLVRVHIHQSNGIRRWNCYSNNIRTMARVNAAFVYDLWFVPIGQAFAHKNHFHSNFVCTCAWVWAYARTKYILFYHVRSLVTQFPHCKSRFVSISLTLNIICKAYYAIVLYCAIVF